MTNQKISSSTSIEQKTVVAFQTWICNNELQMSSIKFYENAQDFEISHYESGTFATLHTFTNIEDGKNEYAKFKKLLC